MDSSGIDIYRMPLYHCPDLCNPNAFCHIYDVFPCHCHINIRILWWQIPHHPNANYNVFRQFQIGQVYIYLLALFGFVIAPAFSFNLWMILTAIMSLRREIVIHVNMDKQNQNHFINFTKGYN